MDTKNEQFPAINSNPLLNVAKDGTVLSSNRAGECILNEWGVRVGEKLPSIIGDPVQRVLSWNSHEKTEISPEKTEIKVGKKVYLIVFHPIPGQETVYISGFDITSQKELEEKIQESEEQHRAIFENSIDAVLLTLPDGTIQAANPAACEIFRMSREDIIKAGRNGIVDTSDPRLQLALEERARTGKFKGELNFRRKDGTTFPGELSNAFFKDMNGIVRTTMIIGDITKRKRVEEALKIANDTLEEKVKERTEELVKAYKLLKDSEEGFTEAQKMAHIGNWEWDNANDKTYWSDEMYRIFDRDPQKSAPSLNEYLSYIHPDDLDYYCKATDNTRKATTSGFDFRIVLANGEERTLHLKSDFIFNDENIPIRTKGIVQDITARKKAEEKIRILADAVETSDDAILTLSLEGIIKSWNRGAEQIFGYSSDIIGKTVSIFEPANLKGENKQLIEKVIQGEKIRHYETLRLRKDGTIIIVSITLSPIFDPSEKLVAISAIARDITEHKKAEEKLRESEEKYRNIVETANDGLLLTSTEFKITYANKRAMEMLGYTLEELLGIPVIDFFKEENKPIASENIQKRCCGICESYESKLMIKDGSPFWALISAKPLFNMDGDFTGLLCMFTDITKRKEAETRLKETLDNLENLVRKRTEELEKAYNSLKESKERLAEAQQMTHIGNWNHNIITGKIYWSDEMYRIFGVNPQEPATNCDDFFKYVHPDDKDYLVNGFKSAFKGTSYSLDHKVILANGEARYVHSEGKAVFDERKNPVQVRGTVQDITERKKSEEKLRESEEKYRNIVETANEGIVIINDEFRATYVNEKMADMVGYSLEECMSKPIWGFISEESVDFIRSNLKKNPQGINGNYEIKLRCKDGSDLWVTTSSKSLSDTNGRFMGLLNMLTNITQKKKAEEALNNIEIARKKEIHHRIKNNLQVMSSLLDLQADKFRNRKDIKDSEVLEAFRESQDRIISMALIHEELYKGGGLEKLNISPYIEKLSENLFLTFSLANNNISLNLKIEDNIYFDMDVVVPLGMIINEIISNSFKHAFQGRNNGEIQIKLFREENREYNNSITRDCENTTFVLTVSDNGVGIPANIDIEELDSLGLQIVTSLVSQLDGKLAIKRNNGTKYTIRFTVRGKK